MPFDEKLMSRVDNLLKKKRGVTKLKMFGGICYLLHGNMCCGIEKERLMLRVGPEEQDRLMPQKHVAQKVFYVPFESDPRHMDTIFPLWNLLDFTPEGRGSDWVPKVF